MKSKQKVILALGILFLLVVTLGGSYSFFRYAKEGSTESSIKIGDITFIYTEDKNLGNGIRIEDALPIDDEEGKNLQDEGNYFDFKVNSNLSRSDLEYEVVAQQIEGSTLPLDAIKLYMTDVTSGEEIAIENSIRSDGSVKTLNEYLDTQIENVDGKTLYQERILKNTKGYEKKFRVRMWIKEGLDWSDDQYMGKSGSIRINVYANSDRSMASTDTTTPDDVRIERVVANQKYLFDESKETSYQYTLTVPNEVHDISIDVIPSNPDATVVVSPMEGSSYSLKVGDNFYKAIVTSSNHEKTKEYILKVVREKSTNTGLNSLRVGNYNLEPAYSDTVDYYTVYVPYETTSVEIMAERKENVQTIEGTGIKNLDIVGDNIFTVTVTAENGTVRTITINIHRLLSDDASIQNVGISGYSLKYLQDNIYTVEVEYPVTSVEIINASMNGASVTGIGRKESLQVGDNDFNVEVTSASKKVTQKYIIRIIRLRDTDNSLKSLEIVGQTIEPEFSSEVLRYHVTVENSITSLNIQAKPNSEVAKVEIFENSNFKVGDNEVQIKVTAQNGDIKTYIITVTRKPSTDATLKGLSILEGELIPTFDPNTTTYTATTELASITVSAVKNHSEASVSGNGSHLLTWGENTITIIVTAEDKQTTKAYTIIINNQRPTAPILGGGSNTWYATDRTVTVTSGQALSGIKQYEYYTSTSATLPDDNTPITGIKTVASPNLIVNANGTTYVYYRTVSNNDNRSAWSSAQIINIDKTTPKVTISGSVASNTNTKDNVILTGTVNPENTASGYTYTWYYIPSGSDKAQKLNDEGITHTITSTSYNDQFYLVVTTGSGVTGTSNTYLSKVDKETPSAPVISGGSNDWTSGNRTISVTKDSSAPSGISKYQYYISTSSTELTDGQWQDCASEKSQTITTEGERYVYFRAVSNSGVEGEVSSGQVTKIDKQTPSAPGVSGDSNVLAGSRIFTLTNPESISGIKSYEYYITDDSTAPTASTSATGSSTSNSITINQTGTYIYFRVINNANTKGSWTSVKNLYVNTAILSSLSVANHTINPTFNPATEQYSVTVPYSETSVTINSTPANSQAKAVVSGTTGLQVGSSNIVKVVVTGPDQTVKTYTITVTRSQDTVNTLDSLGVTGQTLSPTFKKDVLNYTVTVPYSVDKITITGTKTSEVSTITGLGEKSLEVGENPFSIVVQAQNGDTKTYTITVTRQPDTDTSLKSIEIKNHSIVETDDHHYTLTVANSVTSVEIVAVAKSTVAKVSGNVGVQNLTVGKNTFTVTVTAQSGKIDNYEIVITRLASSDATLKSLGVTGYQLSPAFSSSVTNYSITVPNSVTSVTVTATVNNSEASYQITGNTDLKVGNNTVTVTVTAGDKSTKQYIITVKRKGVDTITLVAKSATYTGSAIEANVAIAKSNTGIDYTYYNGTSCSGSIISIPTDVGNYSVKAVSQGNEDYESGSICVTHTITKGTPTVILTDKIATYTGSAIVAYDAVATNPNGREVSLTYTYNYYTDNKCSAGKTTTAPTNAGTYYVQATSTATANLNSANSRCAMHKIDKKTDIITFSNQTKSYTGSDLAVSGAVAESQSTITYTYHTTTDCSGSIFLDAPTNVGTYSVKATSAGNANYNAGSKCVTYSITKGTPTVSLTAKSATYTGSAIAANTATATNPNGTAASLSYTYNYYTDNACSKAFNTTTPTTAPTNVGTYYVKATSTATANLNSASSGCVTHTITKKNDVITFNNQTKSYTGSALTITSGATAESKSTITYAYFSNNTCTTSITAPTNVGTYYVKATSAGNSNYNAGSKCVTYSITKGNPTVSLTAKTVEATGSAIAANAATATNPNGTAVSLSYTYNYYTDNACSKAFNTTTPTTAPTNPGTYYVKATSTATDNLNSASSGCITHTINKNTNNYLKTLAVSGYTIQPTFAKGTLEYTLTVEASSITISATAETGLSSISGTGSKNLSWGANTFTIAVTSQSGAVRNYKITVTNQRPTAPVIQGGSSSWFTSAPTITVKTAGTAFSGLSYYEYYKSNKNTAPGDSTAATGTLKTSPYSLTVSDQGTSYVWYRTVSKNNFKSTWVGPQVIKLDTHPIKLTVKDITGEIADNAYYNLRYDFYLENIKIDDIITYEFNISGKETNGISCDFNDRLLDSNIQCSNNQCTIKGEIVITNYDISIRPPSKWDYSTYRFFDIRAEQTSPVNNISYDVVVHRFTES